VRAAMVVLGRSQQVQPVDFERDETAARVGVDREARTRVDELEHGVTLWSSVMRALVQRVAQASVTIDGVVVGAIGAGLCVFVGITHDDDVVAARAMADKLWNLRIMNDADGVMNLSVAETSREVLVVSQFT